MNYEKLKYIRGYAITKSTTNYLTNWVKLKKNGYYFYFHPQTKWAYVEHDDKWVCLIGHCLDVHHGTDNLDVISQNLLETYKLGMNSLFDYTEKLNGRFVIVLGKGEDTIAFSDAIGMKAIFYNPENGAIASHAKLLAQITNEPLSGKVKNLWLREYSAYHLPGNLTPYSNISQLIPNHYFNLNNFQVKRYFPREDLEENTLEVVINKVTHLVKKQAKLLQDKKILLSLSGGLDSRTSLSLLKNNLNNVKLFTYYRVDSRNSEYKGNETLNKDEAIVRELVDNLHLNHSFIPIDISGFDNEDFTEFSNVLKQYTFLSHNYKLAKLYYDSFREDEYLHIRSNSYEVGRSLLRNNYNFGSAEMDLEKQVICYSPKATADEEIFSIIEEYNQSFDPRGNFNFDPFDLIHWEWRLGLWHSQVVTESDVAFDTHILINSREIYKLFLSVPSNERKKGELLLKMIETNWPILLYWDINKRQTLLERYDPQVSDYGLNLTDVNFTSGNLVDNTATVPYFGKSFINSFKLYINKSGPEKGDYVEAEKLIKTTTVGEKEIVLNLRVPFEAPNLTGRLKYQVIYNEQLIIEEIIGNWQETNQVIIPMDNNIKNNHSLKFRVLAIKDCEPWSLGRAGTLIIERIVTRKASFDDKVVRSSSPYTEVKQ